MPSRRRRRRARRRPARSPFVMRRSTMWLVAAVITLAVGILLGVIANVTGDNGDDDQGDGPAPTLAVGATDNQSTSPEPTLAVELPDLQPSAAQPARVLGVIDGDTIDVRFASGDEERVRYYGIDTPERGDDCYGEATDRNEDLVGAAVLLQPDARERDSFDRLLRYVFTEDGTSVDAQLIAEGLALAWREDGSYRDELVALEGDARAASVGCLWSD